jgi:uncharacterized membrane protein YgdD (TMEM256/DUF423 family)
MRAALLWRRAAAASGASAVGAGAYGAHALHPSDPYYVKVYERGNQYHLGHSMLLAAAPHCRRPNMVGGLAAAGVALFSGSCYMVALTEDRSNAKLAPFG